MKPLTPFLVCLLLTGCESGDQAPPRRSTGRMAEEPAAAPTDLAAGLPSLPPGAALALAPGMEREWTARELSHVPKYFLSSGWADARTLWGLTGSNPILVRVDRPEYSPWGHRAWDAALSPDATLLAGIDERGVWVGRGAETRLILGRDHEGPSGEGDLGGPLLWSPDGSRLLVRWVGEGGTAFATIDAATGELAPIPARGSGYRLEGAFAWIDQTSLLFTARSLLGPEPTPVGRGDLAVHDLRTGVHRRVTQVPEGTFLHPLASWGERALLVGEGSALPGGEGGEQRVRREHHWIYDTRSWARRPIDLPPADQVVAHDATRALLTRREEQDGEPSHQLLLWDPARGARPFARVRGQDLRLAWSPDGRRLAISSALEEPVEGAPGSLRSVYRSWIIEPR